MIGAEYMAKIMAASPREIYRKIDDGQLHFVETADLQVLVCLRSFSLSVTLGKAKRLQEEITRELSI